MERLWYHFKNSEQSKRNNLRKKYEDLSFGHVRWRCWQNNPVATSNRNVAVQGWGYRWRIGGEKDSKVILLMARRWRHRRGYNFSKHHHINANGLIGLCARHCSKHLLYFTSFMFTTTLRGRHSYCHHFINCGPDWELVLSKGHTSLYMAESGFELRQTCSKLCVLNLDTLLFSRESIVWKR